MTEALSSISAKRDGLRIKRGEQRSGQADRPRGLWAFRAGSSVRNLWRAPCVSLTEPSSRSPQPVHEGSRDPAPHSGGVLVLRRLTASLCLTGVCSKDGRAPVAGALCGCSPLFLLWGRFTPPEAPLAEIIQNKQRRFLKPRPDSARHATG